MQPGLLQSLASEQQAIVLLLSVPFVASIVGIARHIVGIKSLGIYSSIVLTYAIYALGLNGELVGYSDILSGIRYGLIFIGMVMLMTYIGSIVFKRTRMHYFPKVAIVISLAALALLTSLVIADLMGRKGFSSTNALALIMIVSVSEQFTSAMFKLKPRKALVLGLETLLICLFCYVLIAWPSFQVLLVSYPYIVLIPLLVSYLVGKYRGLRILEFMRFREILELPEPDDDK